MSISNSNENILSFFNTDFDNIKLEQNSFEMKNSDTGEVLPIKTRIIFDFNANVKFLSIYIPNFKGQQEKIILGLIKSISNIKNGLCNEWQVGEIGDSSSSLHDNLTFSNRVFLYSEEEIEGQIKVRLFDFAKTLGYNIRFRGPEYAKEKSRKIKPLAFISHDSSDQKSIVKPLVDRLLKLNCPVWYSEYALKVGDSLRESIESGIRDCEKCIFIITPNFLSGKFWTKTEFNAVFTLDKPILTVWVNVSPEDVKKYSPTLADKFSVKWNEGINKVAKKLATSLKS